MCVELLETGRVEQWGRLMKVSHEGDRVSRPGPHGKYRAAGQRCGDAYLKRLMADCGEASQKAAAAQLHMQSGCYACSTVQIDQMVDVAASVSGVAGAQIAGAGLGGCIMILAKKDAVEAVRDTLLKRYYQPAGLEAAVLPCIAVEGAGLVEF